MGRIPRDTAAGTFHITLHSVAEAALFGHGLDFNYRLDLFAETVDEAFSLNMFVLMDNHEHLIVTVDEDVLPQTMHKLNLAYARWYNASRTRRGRVYDGPYGSVRIQTERHAQEVARYVARNPAGGRYTAESYPFSSYRALVNGTDEFPFVDPAPILEWFGGGDEARARIRAFVDDAPEQWPRAA